MRVAVTLTEKNAGSRNGGYEGVTKSLRAGRASAALWQNSQNSFSEG
jgi:hypothetical protein